MTQRHSILSLLAILSLTVGIYWPGLNSRFVLDDFQNLAFLDAIHQGADMSAVAAAGFSGPAGRHLSLLSFIPQANAWPSDPFAFKAVNLLLHLLNGLMVWWLLLCLTRVGTGMADNRLALIGTGFWLLAPIHVHTVLYTIQRMTMLSTSFCLLGMLMYLYGFDRLDQGETRSGYRWISVAILGATLAAVLAKENGILLPWYLAILNLTVLAGVLQRTVIFRWLTIGLLAIPVTVIGGYFLLASERILGAFGIREFSPGERLLSEFPVLLHYLVNTLLPRPAALSLFHDDFPVSTGLLSPPLTLLAVLILLSLAGLAIAIRRRYPLPAAGILLFLAGHALEAGPFSLALYFEHRNYFPAIGVALVVVWFVGRLLQASTLRRYGYALVALYALLFSTLTAMEASVWRDPLTQATEWVRDQPASAMARRELAGLQLAQGQIDAADRTLDELMTVTPSDIYPRLMQLYVHACVQPSARAQAVHESLQSMVNQPLTYNLAATAALDNLVLARIQGRCPALPPTQLAGLLQQLIDNPHSMLDHEVLYEFLSSLALYAGDTAAALGYLQQSLANDFDIERKILEITLLDRLGREDGRQQAIGELRNWLAAHPMRQLVYHERLSQLESPRPQD